MCSQNLTSFALRSEKATKDTQRTTPGRVLKARLRQQGGLQWVEESDAGKEKTVWEIVARKPCITPLSRDILGVCPCETVRVGVELPSLRRVPSPCARNDPFLYLYREITTVFRSLSRRLRDRGALSFWTLDRVNLQR